MNEDDVDASGKEKDACGRHYVKWQQWEEFGPDE